MISIDAAPLIGPTQGAILLSVAHAVNQPLDVRDSTLESPVLAEILQKRNRRRVFRSFGAAVDANDEFLSSNEEVRAAGVNSRIGSAMLAASIAGLFLCLAGVSGRLALPAQRIFNRAPLFWSGGALMLFVGGLVVLWKANHGRTAWEPNRQGNRFSSAVLYTRKDCPLCDDARETLRLYRRWLPPLREIDIDIHPDFRDAFSECVPVLEIDDQIRFRGRISPVLLRRMIQGGATRDVTSNS